MEESLEDRIAHHLGACAAYADGQGRPLDRGALEKRAALITLRYRVRKSFSEQVFRVTDAEGAWVCPFWATKTENWLTGKLSKRCVPRSRCQRAKSPR